MLLDQKLAPVSMNRCFNTINTLQSSLQGLIFFILINFYWLFKNPHWANLPSWSAVINPLLMIFCVLIGFLNKSNWFIINRQALYFVALLAAIPLSGNINEFIFGAQLIYDWSPFVEITDQDSDTFYGFRTYIFTSLIFILVARAIAESLSERQFLFVMYASAMLQSIWALPQVIYSLFPDALHFLPIIPKQECTYGGGDCLIITRATGLLLNPFYFAWFYLSVYFSCLVLMPRRHNIILLILSFLSMSRSLIACSVFFLGYELRKNLLLATLVFLSIFALLLFYWDIVYTIIELRLETDISAESRTETNTLAFKELLSGNLFGVGWKTNYYTDSTYTILLLKSGIPGVSFYIVAWILFFRKIFRVTNRNPVVLYFASVFFVSSLFISSVESHPGSLVVFTLYWVLLKRGSTVKPI